MDEAKVEYIANLGTTTVSLQSEDEEGQTIEDRLEINDEEPLHRRLWLEELNRKVSQALDLLTPKEQDVIRCRFGLDDEDPASLRQAGRRLGLSAEGVRQIQAQALKKLQDPDFCVGLMAFVQN